MRRRHADPFEPQQRYNGLSQVEFNHLATYNAERARGIQHTAEWQEEMAALQARWRDHERQAVR